MPKINPQIFRAYDIRGIAQPIDPSDTPDLTEESVYMIGRATAIYLQQTYNTQHMAVGRDVRESSPALQKAFIEGLLTEGLDVTDIGLAPSPMIYFASCCEALAFDSATNITASHNPKEYNGIKTVANNAHSICGDELQKIREIAEGLAEEDLNSINSRRSPENTQPPGNPPEGSLKTPNLRETTPPGTLDQQNIWPLYKEELLTKIDHANFTKPLKVVIDAGNGVAGPFAPELLEQIPNLEVIKLYCEPDGTFPNHEANPEELHNMKDLIEEVRAHKADLGVGYDGDGDRIGIIDEEGTHYSADYLLLLLTQDLVTRHTQPQIVFDVKVSQAIINRMDALGATPVMSKTGHSFIEQRMKDLQALLGGEVSGHMFFGENYYGFDDAFLATLKILEILAKTQTPFSQQFNDLPKTYMTPEFKAHTPDDKKFAIVEQLTAHFAQETDYECITIDGVRVKFDDLSWGAVRASNTSPNLTLRFESTSPERLAKIQEIFIEQLKKHPDVDLGWYAE
ncbi:phosphomannomutase/phosphoglucomutase [Candidatus Peregrinibacteria bacterium]|jgi:phosphomannomutase / phosphoglucomutase|nr:phosphomannomutase/phosphoglucomutase [Candidatus Peregrinibacteria bacterium]MBT4056432.1 phosphomannomutase/phosphoglucomutase [Candidatus Peregrinibacteria bacterium]